MRAQWVRMLCLAGLVAGCGKGEAIFNVDVSSFLKGTGKDTVPYFVLGGVIDTSSAPQLIVLLGAGGSIVDSVILSGIDTLRNESGSGTLAFKLYLAADSAGTRLPGALAASASVKAVSGTIPVPDTIACPPLHPTSCRLSGSGPSLFTRDSLWARVAVTASNTGATPFAGKLALTSVVLSVFVNEKIF